MDILETIKLKEQEVAALREQGMREAVERTAVIREEIISLMNEAGELSKAFGLQTNIANLHNHVSQDNYDPYWDSSSAYC